MTQDETVLYLLREGPKNTHEFVRHPDLAAEFRRSISNLRKKGYVITAQWERKGCWVYTLVL